MCLAIILSLHQAKLCKVADDDVGAAFPEDLRIVAPDHADDEAEAASLARLDPGDGVLYHDAPFRRRPEHPGGLLVGLGGRLAGELLLRSDIAVYSSIEEVLDASRFQHRVAVLAGRDHGDAPTMDFTPGSGPPKTRT